LSSFVGISRAARENWDARVGQAGLEQTNSIKFKVQSSKFKGKYTSINIFFENLLPEDVRSPIGPIGLTQKRMRGGQLKFDGEV
jgi:hypothetical protein